MVSGPWWPAIAVPLIAEMSTSSALYPADGEPGGGGGFWTDGGFTHTPDDIRSHRQFSADRFGADRSVQTVTTV